MTQPTPTSCPLPDRPSVEIASAERVRVAGDVDAFSARHVEAALLPLAASRPHLVVDLTGVGVLTSGGLAMLLRCAARATALGHRFQLLAPESTLVQRVLDLARVPHDVAPA